MARPQKKRSKKYRAKEVQTDPVSLAIAGVHTIPVEAQVDVMKLLNDAYDTLRQGRASREDWNMICQAVNVAEVLSKMHIGDNLLPDFDAGHEALHQIALRMLGKNCSTCYPGELIAVREAIDMHKIQLRICTQAEYSRALKKVVDLHTGGATLKVAKMYEYMAQ